MFIEVFLAVIQAATEFLPVSSSGHLALFSNLLSEPDLFFFTALHFASLLAVLIFTRNEIVGLIQFKREYSKIWIYLIIGTIPAALVGYFFKDLIEKSLSSYLFLGIAFIFTGFILLLTKNFSGKERLNSKSALFIGLMQVFALFPGVSRSGMTISAGIFSGVSREKGAKFSFLLFIPLALGAMLIELGDFYFDFTLLVSFIVTFLLSLLFLNLLYIVIKKGYFWVFSFYCFFIGLVSLWLHWFT